MEKSVSRELACCRCCPRGCGVNRLAGETGFCRIGAGIPVAHIGLHFGEEPPISGSRGSGAIFFAGCNLRCLFCQNYQISQEFQESDYRTLSPRELAAEMRRLEEAGAHNINLVSPSHLIFPLADAISIARAQGLAIPVVYNSNGYDSVEALRQIRGLIDIFLPDLKYLDQNAAGELSAAPDYGEIVQEVLREMFAQVGHLEFDDDGVAQKGLLVRHLVLPGYLENSLSCLAFLAGLSRNLYISIMSQYSPQHKARKHPPLNRTLTEREYDAVIAYALELGLENAFVQEYESSETYLPDFSRPDPFGSQ
ncbi:putative pyruvate formate lyase activating enzyme [Syntrophus gentianae]|uniref:Putative pyruvate formate lyase activating enzyme n=1 Tax=Syntrophus gentianae TaxID=43775 RepID=A0A1H7VT40_9BACT|nr:radical SAM protein [Syntrophus gentianae]SEM11938.1 putative pyruvate formate lyase activating enzyme [Syntrophus gentianae]